MTTIVEPSSHNILQEKLPGFPPVDAGNPSEAGACGMYLFYRWQALGGEGRRATKSRALSGVYTCIRALLRELEARQESYDPRELYAWLDWYVLLRRVADGGPFDERGLDALRVRYCEGWLSGGVGYGATDAVGQILCWEERGSRLATRRLADAARSVVTEWRDELSCRPEAVNIDSPETLRRLSLLRGSGTVWNPRTAGGLLPVVERLLSRSVSSFSTKALEALHPLSLFLDDGWLARRGQEDYACDILRELARRRDLNPFARKAYGMLHETLAGYAGD